MNLALGRVGVVVTFVLALFCLLLATPGSTRAAYPGRPGLIVFNLTFQKVGKVNRETGGLYAIRPGGHDPHRLTSNLGDLAPSFAPSGERLVFVRPSDSSAGQKHGWTHLYTLDMSSGRTTRLTSGHRDHDPSFGPDGMIVFSRWFPGNRSTDLVLRTADGRMHRLTSNAADDDYPVFMPDGSGIVFLRDVDKDWPETSIRSIRLDGSRLRELARERLASQLDVSPNGRRLVLNAWHRLPDGEDSGAVWTKPLKAALPRFHLPNAESAAFSPDGRRLAYTNDEGLWLRRADGGGTRVQVLRADFDYFDAGRRARTPTWQPLP